MLINCRRNLALLAALFPLAGLGGCATPPPVPAVERIDFSAYAPIVLAAGRVDVVDRSSRIGGALDVTLALPPADGVRRWAAARVRTNGSDGAVTVTIKDASVVKTELAKKKSGVEGMFTAEQTSRYDARAVVEVTAVKPSAGDLRVTTTATVSRFVTVPENASLAGREATVQNLVNHLLEDLNVRLDRSIRQDMAQVVVR